MQKEQKKAKFQARKGAEEAKGAAVIDAADVKIQIEDQAYAKDDNATSQQKVSQSLNGSHLQIEKKENVLQLTPSAAKLNVEHARSQPFGMPRSQTIFARLDGQMSRSEAAQNEAVRMSPSGSQNNVGLGGLRSIQGSQARLMSITAIGNRQSMRNTVKLNMVQLKDDTDEDQNFTNSAESDSFEGSKIKQYKRPLVKISAADQPFIQSEGWNESNRSSARNRVKEEPLKEEPIPEQRSFKHSVFSGAKRNKYFRASTDLKLGFQEAPVQPQAQDAPPIANSTCKSAASIAQVPKSANQLLIEQEQSDTAKNQALKVQTAGIDPVQDNLATSQNQEEEEESEDSAVFFPQDALFTNANSSPMALNFQPGSEPGRQLQSNYVSPQIRLPIQQQQKQSEQAVPDNIILRSAKNQEEFDKLVKHLRDPDIYVLNSLKEELDQEPKRGLPTEQAADHDQTSMAIMQHLPSDMTDLKLDEDGESLFLDGRLFGPRNKSPKQPSEKQNMLRRSMASHSTQQQQLESFGAERIATEDDPMMANKSVIDFFDDDQSRVVHQQVEHNEENLNWQNGLWLQKRIDSAKPNEILYLQSIVYKFQSLYIRSPVTLVGQPETILEVDGGSIFIDFGQSDLQDDQMNNCPENDEVMVPSTPARDSIYLSQATRETFKGHPLNRGTPLTIKKSKVARIQVCEIRYNRTKASLTAAISRQQQNYNQQASAGLRGAHSQHTNRNTLDQNDNQHFSRDISLGATQNAQNLGGQQPSMTLLQLSSSKQAPAVSQNSTVMNQRAAHAPDSALSQQQPASACFVVEHNSFVEVKDCFIKSVKDKTNVDQELDVFYRSQGAAGLAQYSKTLHQQSTAAHQNERTESRDIGGTSNNQNCYNYLDQRGKLDTEIRDYCFALNLPEVAQRDITGVADFSGLVSLCSTTVQNFMFGVYCGPDAVLACETSSFISLRAGGCAIKGLNPKQLKFMNGSIQKCEANGVHVIIDDPKMSPQVDTLARANSNAGEFSRVTSNFAHNNSTRREYEVLQTERSEQEAGSDVYSAMIQRLTRKVYIENNRLVQVQGCPVLVEGPQKDHYLQYFVKVKDNRISNCGLDSKLYTIPGATESEKEIEQRQMKAAYERIGGPPKACIYLRNLHLFDLSCFRNTISKGSGSGITIQNVKGHKEDMTKVISLPTTEQEAQSVYERCVGDEQRVTVVDNYVIEISAGYGMVIDGSTCHMELNQLKKNALGGLLITSTAPVPKYLPMPIRRLQKESAHQTMQLQSPRMGTEAFDTARSFGNAGANESDQHGKSVAFGLPSTPKQYETVAAEQASQLTALRLSQIKHFCSVTMDNSTSMNNQKFGIGVLGFYGTVTIKSSHINENETDGIVFSKLANDADVQGRRDALDDEAAFLDFGDCTERSNNNVHNMGRSRSIAAVQPTEHAMLEGCMTSYRNELADSPEKLQEMQQQQQQLIPYDRPFEKQVRTVHLLKCHVMSNRQDGMVSVDIAIQALGCIVQGNMGSAVRVCSEEKGASCQLFVKARSNNEAELVGSVNKGYGGSRYKPKILIDSNLPQLLANLQKVQMLANQVEMVQMTQQEPQMNLKASMVSRKSEEKLMNMIESQKSIIEQRDSRKKPSGSTSARSGGGFLAFFKCCMSPKARAPGSEAPMFSQPHIAKNSPAKGVAAAQAASQASAQAEYGAQGAIKQVTLNNKAKNQKRISKK